MRTLSLTEHRAKRFARDTLSESQANSLISRFGPYLDIAFPSVLTGNQWQLSSNGWIGAFRVDASLQIVVSPKVPIRNLGQMLVSAYDLPIEAFPGLVECRTLTDLYDHLVRELARRTMLLTRQGLQQEYRTSPKETAVVRGRIEFAKLMRRPVVHRVPIRVTERTADVIENQLVSYTLDRALRSGLCSTQVQTEARAAYRLISAVATPIPVTGRDCAAVRYTRLTERYREPHALCRLLLDSAGPIADAGESVTTPFLLNMPRLFEMFVARWLGQHLPSDYQVATQVRHTVGSTSPISFFVDIVIRDCAGQTVCVLDTKYKDSELPGADDVAQIGFYALLERCHLAGLIVPTSQHTVWDGRAGEVQAFRSSFDLSDDLATSGTRLVDELLGKFSLGVPSPPSSFEPLRHQGTQSQERANATAG